MDKKYIVLILLGVVYLIGCLYFNAQVESSCTHGNCKHGWYSKFNNEEKLEARLWMYGFPFSLFVLYMIFFPKNKKNSHNSLKKNDVSTTYYNGYHWHQWPSGTKYEGQWVNGQISGNGKFTYASGETYEGVFLNGKSCGDGIYIWPNGMVYEGPFYKEHYLLFGPGKCKFKILMYKKSTDEEIYLEVNTELNSFYNNSEIPIFIRVEASSFLKNNNCNVRIPCLDDYS